ncbi:MAG: glycosyltransferase family 2 protein [Bacteroidia bacterium]
MSKQKISVIIPAFNEATNIRLLYDEILVALSAKEEHDFEFIFIDDGSTDGTLSVIKNLSSRDERIFYIELSRNFGHQYAIKAGLDIASGDAIITMDCDLQHPPEVINKLLEKWNEGFDIVYTRRKDDLKISWFKRITSAIFYRFLNWASDLNLEKGTADFRLINRNVINAFKGFKENELFLRGLVKWAGFRQTAVDYKANQRHSGKSKYSFKKMLSFAFRGITAFSIRPLKLVAYVGLLMFIVSLILIPYALISYFVGQAVPGWTSLIISIIFFGSLQLFMLGIIGLYLSKIAIQSKQRPQYLIRDTNYSTKFPHENIG